MRLVSNSISINELTFESCIQTDESGHGADTKTATTETVHKYTFNYSARH